MQEITTRRIVQLHDRQGFATAPDGSLTVGRRADGDCQFHQDARCGLQQAGGEGLLPSACRHFPRVILRDARGSLLTLSHYCPTAAALLVDGSQIAVVEAHEPIALAEPIEGLDARAVLPPLLRPGMLMDLEAYGHFERRCLDTFSAALDADTALAAIGAAIESIRTWSPGHESLIARIDHAFDAAPLAPPVAVINGSDSSPGELSAGFATARSLVGPHPWIAVPADFASRWSAVHARGGRLLQGVLLRYLAAATFGNWMAYRSEGLRSVQAWLRACYDIFRIQLARDADPDGHLPRPALIEALRSADYLVVHTIDSLAFGRAAVAGEHAQTPA